MYDHILHPTDGSDVAERARAHAIDLADRYDASLHVLHVLSLGEVDEVSENDRDLVEDLRDQGEDVVATAVEEARSRGVEDVDRTLREGQPTDEILDCADDCDADLVVMGTHGRSGLAHYLVGSVAEKVVRHATCAVQTVPDATG
ncbi:MAG: universal stress protein [Haloarculaceae archaeon]